MTSTCAAETVSNIRIVGCDGGDVFHVHGDDAGAEGVKLLKGSIQSLIEAPIKVLERTPIRMDGGVLRAVKTEIMEPVISVGISGRHINEQFGEVDGSFREAFSYQLDEYDDNSSLARIEWDTEHGTRWLEVVLSEGSSYEAELDPHKPGSWIWDIHLKAYVPYWQEEPEITPVTFTTAGTKTVTVSNPSGVECYHRWIGTVAQYRLPDNSWSGRRWDRTPGGLYPTRTVLYPALTTANGGLIVDYDPSQLPVRDAADHNLIAQMPVEGDYPKFCLPTFLQDTELTVQAVSVPSGGAMLQLVQPRRFRKPWGRV